MATELAGRIVGESLEDDDRRARTVERFISALEQSSETASTAGAS
jgi:F-type H+-transporting ATPase subunit b